MIQRIKNNAFARNSLVLFAGTMVANVIGYIFSGQCNGWMTEEIFFQVTEKVYMN